uniref:C-factor n=1 Tax=Cairina moschata TaxID=8855 RepID=A0A8C3GNF0_CAIMO
MLQLCPADEGPLPGLPALPTPLWPPAPCMVAVPDGFGCSPPHLGPAEVTELASIKAAAASVGERLKDSGLNLLINNAGIGNNSSLDNVTQEDLAQKYATNTIGPLLLSQAFLPLLKKAAQGSPGSGLSCSKAAIINMSSYAGSIQDVYVWEYGEAISYRCSKAALNMLTKCQSLGYREHGILCAAFHPGWVITDMGGTIENKTRVTVDVSVRGMLKVMSSLSEKDTGTFVDWEGKVLPW